MKDQQWQATTRGKSMTPEQKIIAKLDEMKHINIQKDEVELLIERVVELNERPANITHIDIQGYKFVVPNSCIDSLGHFLTAMHHSFTNKRTDLIRKAEKIINEN